MALPDDDGSQLVAVRREGAALVIIINRPRQRNAINKAVADSIAQALSALDGSPDLRAGILYGAGGTFSAGADIKALARGERAHVPGRGFAGLVEMPPAKPLIAAVEGWALGGGFEIVLACDLVVAARGARFGLPEIRRGLVAGGGGAMRLPHRLPRPIAMEILFTGEPIDAQRAAHFGLVNQVVDDGAALTAALAMAEKIGQSAPLALAAAKRVAVESPSWPPDRAFALQNDILAPVFASKDAREGVRAFAEHRPPVWRGE